MRAIIFNVFFDTEPFCVTEKVLPEQFMEVFGTIYPDERDIEEAGFLLKKQLDGIDVAHCVID